jgi:hypothetical protein
VPGGADLNRGRLDGHHADLADLGEPHKHFVERARHPDDMPAVKLQDGLVVAFVRIMDDGNAVLPNRIADAIYPRSG